MENRLNMMLTGAIGGLGYALVKRFTLYPLNLIITGRNSDKLKDLEVQIDYSSNNNIKRIALKCDVRNKTDIRNAISQIENTFGNIDILINNAGVRTDNGAQPTSVSFMRNTSLMGIEQIFCSYNNPKANAETERVIRAIKEELLWLNEFTSFEESRDSIGNWIREDYNRLYVHSALGYQSPEEFQQQWECLQAQEAVSGGC